MATPVDPDERELADFVRGMKEGGFSERETREKLLAAGWDPAFVDKKLAWEFRGRPAKTLPQPGTPPSPRPVRFKGNIDKFRTLFLSPTRFFEGVAEEDDYSKPLLTLAAVYGIVWLINILVMAPIMPVMKEYLLSEAGPMSSLLVGIMGALIPLSLVFGAISAVTGVFLLAGLNHLGVRIFGGTGGFYNTFKPTVYAYIASLLYGVVTSIIAFIPWLADPEGTLALNMESAAASSISSGTALSIITGLINMFLGMFIFVHVLYILITGISRFQNMSRGKALVSVLVLPIGLSIVLFIFVFALILMAAALA